VFLAQHAGLTAGGVQGVTVDEERVNAIKKLAEKLITQGRTDTKFIQDKRDSLVTKYVCFLNLVINWE